MLPRLTALTLLTLLCAIANAEIYRSTDEQGNPVYSDTASPGSEAVDLPQPNTTPAVDTERAPDRQSDSDTHSPPAVRISAPSNGAILPNGRLPTTVRIDSDRPLSSHHTLILSVDGQRLSLPATTPVEHRIPLLSRGPHSLEVILKAADGEILSRDRVDIIVRWPG